MKKMKKGLESNKKKQNSNIKLPLNVHKSPVTLELNKISRNKVGLAEAKP